MRFFSPPEKPTLSGALQHVRVDLELRRRAAHGAHEVGRRQLRLAARAPLRVERGLEEGHGRDAGDFDRILEGEEHALGGALVGSSSENVLAVEQHFAAGDLIVRLAGDDIGERRLAGAVRPHDGRDLAGLHGEVEAIEDRLAVDGDGEVLDFEHERIGRN